MIDILVLLDRSGSMQDRRTDHEGGLRSFVNDQRSLPGDVRFTLIQFDTQDPCEVVYDRVKLEDVGAISLLPRGGTPLLDAMGKGTAHLLAKQATEPPEQTAVMVITDGEENESREWTRERVKALVKELEGKAWTFLFLGADLDAFAEAGALGISTATSAGFSHHVPGSVNAMYSTVSNKLAGNRVLRSRGHGIGASSGTMNFTASDMRGMATGEAQKFDAGAASIAAASGIFFADTTDTPAEDTDTSKPDAEEKK